MKVYIIYLNDIFIYNRIKKKHDFHIKTILYAFNKIEMILNLEKCKFFQKKVKFLFYIINKNENKSNSQNIEKIIN